MPWPPGRSRESSESKRHGAAVTEQLCLRPLSAMMLSRAGRALVATRTTARHFGRCVPPRPPPHRRCSAFSSEGLTAPPARLRSAYAALSPEQINPKIKDMEYAVRGQLVINAMVRPQLPASPPPGPAAALSRPEVQSQRARSPDARAACSAACRRTSRPWRTASRARSPTSCCVTSATRSPSDNSRSPSPAR